MSVLDRGRGKGVALLCDAGCGRKFFPRSTRTHGAKTLRDRAALYGWSTIADSAGSLSDLCPDHGVRS